MITEIEEIGEIKLLFAEVKDELAAPKARPSIRHLPLGIMIEVPAAAALTDLLVREVDYLSIGTNDLIQYYLAVDRSNEDVAYLYKPLHPSVLRLLRFVIETADRAGKEVSICGEMAADPLSAMVLLGLGLRRFSMNPIFIPRIKKALRAVEAKAVRRVVHQAMTPQVGPGGRGVPDREAPRPPSRGLPAARPVVLTSLRAGRRRSGSGLSNSAKETEGMEGQTFTISNVVMGIAAILWSAVVGMAIIAFGQLLLAIREMAHNTRKEGVHGPHYNILLLMAKVNNLLGWLMLAAGPGLRDLYDRGRTPDRAAGADRWRRERRSERRSRARACCSGRRRRPAGRCRTRRSRPARSP